MHLGDGVQDAFQVVMHHEQLGLPWKVEQAVCTTWGVQQWLSIMS